MKSRGIGCPMAQFAHEFACLAGYVAQGTKNKKYVQPEPCCTYFFHVHPKTPAIKYLISLMPYPVLFQIPPIAYHMTIRPQLKP
jgi:hypothetical protein